MPLRLGAMSNKENRKSSKYIDKVQWAKKNSVKIWLTVQELKMENFFMRNQKQEPFTEPVVLINHESLG